MKSEKNSFFPEKTSDKPNSSEYSEKKCSDSGYLGNR
jgi:hypothetical protein